MALALAAAACQTPDGSLPRGGNAYSNFPAKSPDEAEDYRIGAFDTLSITVFKEPDLTFKEIQVDAGGSLLFPLIGEVRASGKTPKQLAGEIAASLNERFLRNAQVSVGVPTSASQRVTVEGNVQEPGVYPINGASTLLQAIALAKSPTRVARDEVIIFRFVDGQRMGAIFHLNEIRSGRAPDPSLRGGDTVVVGFSAVKGAFRDLLTTAPFFNLFRPY